MEDPAANGFHQQFPSEKNTCAKNKKNNKKKRLAADMNEALLRLDFGKSREFILSLGVCAMENIRGCFCQLPVPGLVWVFFLMSRDLMTPNNRH